MKLFQFLNNYLRRNFLLIILLFIVSSCEFQAVDLTTENDLIHHSESDTVLFAVIGDYGLASKAEELVANLVKSWEPDFIITTGDNNYPYGSRADLVNNITQYYGDYIYNFDAPENLKCNGNAFEDSINRFFPSPGNHDFSNPEGITPYLDYFSLPGPELYYRFDWGPISFFSLNSNETNISEQKDWLQRNVKKSTKDFKIVYFHHSPYSSSRHGNNEKFQWDFLSMGINVVLTGHDHVYSHIEKKGEEGLHYIINGIGGRNRYKCDSFPLPEETFSSFCYNENYGAMKATSSKNQLKFEFFSISHPDSAIDVIEISGK